METISNLKRSIENLIDNNLSEIVSVRKEIHSHPELGFEELRTSSLVSNWLESQGIEVRKGVAKTGVIGLLRGSSGEKTVGLRADMDALPLPEETGLPYASVDAGKAHSCGHDGHVAILLGTAKILSSLQDHLNGNVKFIFQPAEEGGGGGNKICRKVH